MHLGRATLVALVPLLVWACSSTPDGGSGTNTSIFDKKDAATLGDAQPDTGEDSGATDEQDIATADGGANDTGAAGDTGPGDAKSGDGGPITDFGKVCKSDADCQSGWCIEGYAGFFCSKECAGQCPQGYLCQKTFAGGKTPVSLCVAPVSKICHPCNNDLDCSGGTCVKTATEQFCAPACDAAKTCPGSHTCKDQPSPDGGAALKVCMPNSGSCNCSAKTLGVVRACQQSAGPKVCYGVEVCEASGFSACQLPDEVCNGQDDNCNGNVDEGFVDVKGQYTTVQACGACGNNCAVLQYAHATTICDTGAAPAQCNFTCAVGFFDVNDNPKDGCECAFGNATDVPDGSDQNCDGIDGEVENGIFVAQTGKDSNAGTLLQPVATVAKGTALAAQKGKRDVYVATGVYEENISLAAGAQVFGGYSANFLFHDAAAYETVLLGVAANANAPGTVNVIGLGDAKVTLDGFTVYGANVKQKGASTYAIYVKDAGANLRITGNHVVAGNAGNGTPGSAGGNGDDGVPGSTGGNAKDTGKAICAANDATNGGAGGSKSCGGVTVNGGKGGKAICPDYDEDGAQPKSSPYKQTLTPEEQGVAGQGSGGGKGGTSGYDALIWEGSSSCGICNVPKAKDGDPFLPGIGTNGADGADGTPGSAGSACNAAGGNVAGGLWLPGVAGAGGPAGPGAGGGGGGAGGGVEVSAACVADAKFKFNDIGASGGGGGSGGCSGSGGSGAGSGGGAFALFLVWTAPPAAIGKISGNVLVTGNGGDGGNGGFGGVGGQGGDGKFGGADDPTGLAWCANPGGRGGQGGNGGHGGGGGGGCGGASFGLFAHGNGSVDLSALKADNQTQVIGLPGVGGDGGKSLGKSGGNGAAGAGGAANF